MSEYIDRDAFATEMKERKDAAWKWLIEAKDYETATRADAVLSFIYEVKLTLDKMPTVDAVPVVRCKDCIYYKDAEFNVITEHDRVCAYAIGHHFYREPDEYCSKGKRKGGADDGE